MCASIAFDIEVIENAAFHLESYQARIIIVFFFPLDFINNEVLNIKFFKKIVVSTGMKLP